MACTIASPIQDGGAEREPRERILFLLGVSTLTHWNMSNFDRIFTPLPRICLSPSIVAQAPYLADLFCSFATEIGILNLSRLAFEKMRACSGIFRCRFSTPCFGLQLSVSAICTVYILVARNPTFAIAIPCMNREIVCLCIFF